MQCGGKYRSQCCASVNRSISSSGTSHICRISHCVFFFFPPPPSLATALVLLPLKTFFLEGGSLASPAASAARFRRASSLFASSSAAISKFPARQLSSPYVSISRRSLFAAAWIGMPVQWKEKGKSTAAPLIRWYPAAKSALVSEKACPKCSRPFMYG
jgi:hypothetical protein